MKHPALPLLALSCPLPSPAQPMVAARDAAQIVRSAQRLVTALPGERRFLIVTEMPSEKYVQFAADHKAIAFDIPLFGALRADAEGTFRDVDCSQSPPAMRRDEVDTRYVSVDEERRLKAVLDAAGHAWRTEYCISESQEGRRVGFNATLKGQLPGPKAVVPFVERVFKEAYGLPAVRAIEIETDE